MERVLLIDCPALGPGAGPEGEGDEGARLRQLARLVDALAAICPWVDPVRAGVCALPVRGPARYFGGEAAVVARVAACVADILGGEVVARLGVAEGVFAAELAARTGVVVPPGATTAFLASWPVGVLATPDLSDLLPRLGVGTLGALAALPTADVLARFGAAGGRGQRLARGEEGELPGYRTPGLAGRLAVLQYGVPLRNRQPGFWGGTSAADERAAEALTALQRRLGPAAAVVAAPVGGRGPEDRVRFIPWQAGDGAPAATGVAAATGAAGPPAGRGTPPARSGVPAGRPGPPPWPGQLPPPAPARVAAGGREVPVEVVDARGAAVGVTGRGMLTAVPARMSLAGGPWMGLAGWSAPWPVEERWWSRSRRRSVRLQVVTAAGRAHLLVVERGRWRLAATYD